MNNKPSRRSFKVLLHFFIPYALLLSLFGGAGWFVYERTSWLVEEDAKESAQAVLEGTKETLDRRFVEIETIAMQAASGTKALSFLYVKEPFEGTNPVRMRELNKELFDYTLVNHFLMDYYLVYIGSEMAISPHNMYTLKQLYDLKFRYQNTDYASWKNELSEQTRAKAYVPGRPSLYEGKAASVVTYMQPFGSGNHNGLVMMLIDNAQIQGMLQNLAASGGFAFIADEEGKVISGVGDPDFGILPADVKDGYSHQMVDGQNMFVTRTTSSYNGWTYVSVQPEKIVMERVEYIKKTFFTILAIALIGGLLAAMYFSYRNSRWLWTILRILPAPRNVADTASVRNTMDYIGHSVTSLIFSHESLSEKLDEQLPLIRSAFYNRLLRGQFASGKDIILAMEHSRVAWEGPYVVVAILQLASYEGAFNEEMLGELDIQRLGIREMIAKEYGKSITAHDWDEYQIVLFIHGDAASPSSFMQETRKMLEELRENAASKLQVPTYIAAGGCYKQWSSVSRSFEEAGVLQQHKEWSAEEAVACHGDIAVTARAYYYPSDIEQRLISLVKSGNLQETGSLLAQIKEKNLSGKRLPQSVGRILISELSGTVLKCCEQSSISMDALTEETELALKASEPKRSLEEGLGLLGDAFLSLCRKHHERKKSHNEKLKEDLIAYMESRYSRTDLSLTVLAELFQTSETYISYFFKEQTGINFSDYLENLRMNHAKKLLVESGASVNEIAIKVGYYSLNSFSRAFKRANGMSATEYRKQA
ncbi:AraC family transcriptional regulator [Paenibacillus sp. LHD-117]|uniref:AraC family transcriptional regulator n=1 Tax=Paenibacillus sp. LHD-117 TaxID=3071412 RepID=UPI0027E0A8FB|nr:AraC family transcriptional regulator [Paenibacillus sp. LHD-117]MDQ6422735.1 AraC family transcriptional regulator [Paenibacillus sp. LHD-117]